jgi:protein CpxP
MKKVLMICGLLLGVITFAQAQDGGGRKMQTPEERATKRTEQLTKKLNLTADQQTKVKAIFLDQATAMSKLREENKGDRDGAMAKMKAAGEDTDAKLGAVLTDDQKKTYEEMKANMKKRGPGGPDRKGPADGGGRR